MRVLNLDLDFFLNERVNGRADDPNSRPDNWGLVPWKPASVVKYLENVLNLIRKAPGCTVRSHHEVFFCWRSLIKGGLLTTPFFASHVDAHADLGLGTPAWTYLHSDFIAMPICDRDHPEVGNWGLNFASFMAFAIGNRWFREIDFIVPHFWHDDIPRYLLTDDSPPPSGARGEFYTPDVNLKIEIMHAPRQQIDESISTSSKFTAIRKSIGEPQIPFNIIAEHSVAGRYKGKDWDYIFLSHSPGYVPTEADALLPVISDYIENIDIRERYRNELVQATKNYNRLA